MLGTEAKIGVGGGSGPGSRVGRQKRPSKLQAPIRVQALILRPFLVGAAVVDAQDGQDLAGAFQSLSSYGVLLMAEVPL